MPEFTQEEFEKASRIYDFMTAQKKLGNPGVTIMQSYKQRGFKNDPPGNPVGPFLHGNGGLFATPGQEPTVFNTFVRPIQSVANRLPVMPSGSAAPDDQSFGGYDSPFFTTVTGITQGASEDFDNQPNELCDDPPVGGLLKACTLTAQFGRYYQATRELSINQVGRLVNRGEPTDLRLMGGLLNGGTPFQTPQGVPLGGDGVLRNEFQSRLLEAGASFQRLMARQTWTGNPTNDMAGGGAKQFAGLDLYIAAGNKVDINGTACPSMDADIKDFGYDLVTGNNRDIVQYVDMLYYFLNKLAMDTGLDPVQFAFAMRPELFDELVKVWPIRYYEEFLTQMTQFTQGFVNVEAVNSANFRDEMRNGSYLVVRGQRVPVLLDMSIAEQTPTDNANITPGQYASDIYLIPFTVLGGIPVTWWEYFREDNTQAMELERFAAGQTWTTDGGQFRWFMNHKNGCIVVSWKTEPRIIMRTPQLSGRIQNVKYEPLQHTREAFPDEPYFVNGGRTNTNISTVYTEWATSSPTTIG